MSATVSLALATLFLSAPISLCRTRCARRWCGLGERGFLYLFMPSPPRLWLDGPRLGRGGCRRRLGGAVLVVAGRLGDHPSPASCWSARCSAIRLSRGPARRRDDRARRAGVFAITRHPMNWSFMLWALVHLSLSGSARNLIVAGGILFLALFGSLGQDRKKRRLLGQTWRDWQARTSFMPFGALLQGRIGWRAAFPGWVALLGGLALWALATSWHAPSVSPLGDLLSRSGG